MLRVLHKQFNVSKSTLLKPAKRPIISTSQKLNLIHTSIRNRIINVNGQLPLQTQRRDMASFLARKRPLPTIKADFRDQTRKSAIQRLKNYAPFTNAIASLKNFSGVGLTKRQILQLHDYCLCLLASRRRQIGDLDDQEDAFFKPSTLRPIPSDFPHVSVTSLRESDLIFNKHLADALSIIPTLDVIALQLQKQDQPLRIVDVGSGGGLPGIVISIVRPQYHITAIDTVGKKCDFMTATAKRLNLKNFTVVRGNAENLTRPPVEDRQYSKKVTSMMENARTSRNKKRSKVVLNDQQQKHRKNTIYDVDENDIDIDDDYEQKYEDLIGSNQSNNDQGGPYREIFDVAVSRGVASLDLLSELCLGFVRPGGYMICQKSVSLSAKLEPEGEIMETEDTLADEEFQSALFPRSQRLTPARIGSESLLRLLLTLYHPVPLTSNEITQLSTKINPSSKTDCIAHLSEELSSQRTKSIISAMGGNPNWQYIFCEPFFMSNIDREFLEKFTTQKCVIGNTTLPVQVLDHFHHIFNSNDKLDNDTLTWTRDIITVLTNLFTSRCEDANIIGENTNKHIKSDKFSSRLLLVVHKPNEAAKTLPRTLTQGLGGALQLKHLSPSLLEQDKEEAQRLTLEKSSQDAIFNKMMERLSGNNTIDNDSPTRLSKSENLQDLIGDIASTLQPVGYEHLYEQRIINRRNVMESSDSENLEKSGEDTTTGDGNTDSSSESFYSDEDFDSDTLSELESFAGMKRHYSFSESEDDTDESNSESSLDTDKYNINFSSNQKISKQQLEKSQSSDPFASINFDSSSDDDLYAQFESSLQDIRK